jgi:UDP-glucose 4-epimerase
MKPRAVIRLQPRSHRAAWDVASSYAATAKAERLLRWQTALEIDDMCASSWTWQSENPRAMTHPLGRGVTVAVLVTGIAGFIGMHTAARLLERGETVIGVDNFNAYYSVALKEARIAELERIGGDLTVHRVDIGDNDALAAALAGANFDRIVHLAAQAGG